MSDKSSAAILQMEFDLKRFEAMKMIGTFYNGRTPAHIACDIAQACLYDVAKNKGTLVFVVSAEKITIVQRSDAEHP